MSEHIYKAPEIITSALMAHSTHYDKMTNEERGQVFKAYKFNPINKTYQLTNPKYLTERIIRIMSN